MTTAEWILNCSLLGWVLLRNLGTRPVTRSTYLVPLAVVAVAAGIYLRNIPGGGNDHLLELAGIGAGLVFGLAAAASTRLFRDGSRGLMARAGVAFAAVWVIAIGGRIALPSSPPTPGDPRSPGSPSPSRSPAPTPGGPPSS